MHELLLSHYILLSPLLNNARLHEEHLLTLLNLSHLYLLLDLVSCHIVKDLVVHLPLRHIPLTGTHNARHCCPFLTLNLQTLAKKVSL